MKAKHIFGALKESIIFLSTYVFLLFPFHWKFLKNKKRPILFIHGYLNNSNVWVFLGKYLEKKGFGPIYTINLGSPFNSIETYSKRVIKKAILIAKENNTKDLILIGHSMGGLVSLLASDYKDINITDIVFIAVPFEGTKTSILGFGECTKEMSYKAKGLAKIKKRVKNLKKVNFLNIISHLDHIVIPFKSASLKDYAVEEYIFDNVGHASLLFSKRVAKKIVSFLRG